MRNAGALLLYLGLFSMLFFLSVWGLMTKTALVDVGIGAASIDLIIASLSLLGIMKTVWHLSYV